MILDTQDSDLFFGLHDRQTGGLSWDGTRPPVVQNSQASGEVLRWNGSFYRLLSYAAPSAVRLGGPTHTSVQV